MNKIYLRDAGVLISSFKDKYFSKKEFFTRLDNAIFLSKKFKIGLQLTLSKNFFLENIKSFEERKLTLEKIKNMTIHLHAFYDSLFSNDRKTKLFVKKLNLYFKNFKNLKGFCVHPDNVSTYLELKKIKKKNRYLAIEVCDLKSKSGNNFIEIKYLLQNHKFLDLVLDSAHINQIREKYSNEYTFTDYFKIFKEKIVEIQLSTNKNLYKKIFLNRKLKTDHSLMVLEKDKYIFKELVKLRGLKATNIVIEGVVPFSLKGKNLLNKEIKLINKLK